MILRERRKVEDDTPPPTVARRGRGTGSGTPRGKVQGGPTTPIARKAFSKFITPPHSDHFEELDTPTTNSSVSQLDTSKPATFSQPHSSTHAQASNNISTQPTQSTHPTPGQGQQGQPPKIVLRFTRPTPLPPAEIASLPSPITPLPPSHHSIYPHLTHLKESITGESIDQRLDEEKEKGDYMNARTLPKESGEKNEGGSPRLPGAFT